MEGSEKGPCQYRGSFCTKLWTEVPKHLAVTLTVPHRHQDNLKKVKMVNCSHKNLRKVYENYQSGV